MCACAQNHWTSKKKKNPYTANILKTWNKYTCATVIAAIYFCSVRVHPFIHIAPPQRLTRDAPSDELTGCNLARRGHSASAWQSCHDTQTWLTTASCCISEPSDVEDERNIRSKGWISGIFWLFREPRWQPFTERLLDNWAALLSVRQARRRLSIPESRIAEVDLREGFRGGVTQIFPPLFFYIPHAIVYVKFCDGILAIFTSPCARKTDMNHLAVATRSSAPTAVLFLAVTWKDRTILFAQGHGQGVLIFRAKIRQTHGSVWSGKQTTFARFSVALSWCTTKKRIAHPGPGRERGQVRFGVSGCAERPSQWIRTVPVCGERVMRTHMPRTKRH